MRAWVLNLDADLELGAGPSYAPSKSVLAAMRTHAERLAETLLDEGDVWIANDSHRARGMIGRAFCPTPRALAALERAGAVPEPHPSLEVLRRVNSRAFCVSSLPGARFAQTRAEALEILSRPPPIGEHWRVKRNFGMAGRGQRVIRSLHSEADLAFVGDEVQVEPNVHIETEYAIHGIIDHEVRLGRLVRQRCDRAGQWLASERCTDEVLGARSATQEIEERMRNEATLVASELRAAGYFGPFGVDGYAYRGGFNARSEINARYSMAFACGFFGR